MKAFLNKIKEKVYRRRIRKEGGEAFSSYIRKYYKNKYNIIIGYGTYGGCFNPKNIPPNTIWGNYCSIAQDVKVFRANHPISQFTMHPLLYNPIMGYVQIDQLERPQLIVGHDVWIGANAIILPSVKTIGNGAVIGAGSVVTKDVKAYTVVAGNPAKQIKDRFSPSIVEKLEESKWWDLDKESLIKNIDKFHNITNDQY